MFQLFIYAMDAAEIPDDTRDWNALDIFIFSNGQHCTPPRKYHLQSDELKNWDSTLRFLAHSQYGSLHSLIELYSVEGKKVDGPLELSNDAAYVAVTPPDPFIQAGYDKYLLKASRSWEKRQEKRLGTLNPAVKDDNNVGFSSNKVKKSSKDSTILNDEKEKFKSKSNIPIINSKRPNSLSKSPSEKRKVLNPRSTVLRKINNSRLSSNTTQSSQGKPTSTTKTTHPISKDTLNYISLKNKPMASTILEIETSESKNDDETHTNVVNAPNPIQSVSNLYREKSKSDIALENTIAENDIDKEADIQRNVYRNLESDPISLFVDADKGFTAITNNEPNTPTALPLKSNENVKVPNNNKNINIQSVEQEKITKDFKNNNDFGTQKSTISIAEKIKSRHNHECTINFNLNIEVKDFSAHSKYNSDTFTKSIRLNSDKTAKQSQTNLEFDLDRDVITTNNYINQLNTINPLDGRSCFGCQNKVVIIRCSCNEKTSHNSLTQNNANPKESAVVLSKDENISERFEDVKNIQEQDGEENRSVTINPEGMINREDTTSKIHSVKEYNVSRSTYSPEISATLAKSSKKQEDVQNCDKLTIPTSTQTEWCNILVEARCNEEGNYSFHLPSIEKLKEFNL